MRRYLFWRPCIAALVFAGSLRSQEPPGPRFAACPRQQKNGATVQGRVINDSTGRPIPSRGVLLVGIACFAVTDSSGSFAFEPVRPGQYLLGAGDLGYRRFRPIPLDLRADTTVDVTIRLRPEDLLADCFEAPFCRSFLAPQATDTSLSLDEALRELAFRITIALTVGDDSIATWIPCIEGADARVLGALRLQSPNARSSEECIVDSLPRRRLAVRVRGTETPGRLLAIDNLDRDGPDRARSNTHFYAGPLWAAGWRCLYVLEASRWRAASCTMTWIS